MNYRNDRAFLTVEDVLNISRAPATVTRYRKAFEDWKDWCNRNSVNIIPAQKEDIARYYMFLYNNGAPYSRLEIAHCAIKWFHDCAPFTESNPCDSKYLRLVLDGCKRMLARPKNKKEPITPDILARIVCKYGNSRDLKDIRLCAMTLLAYAGFFRHSELVDLRVADVQFFPSHIKCFIRHSKTDQYREGAGVLVAATSKPTCPVDMLKKYMSIANITPGVSEEYLFRPLVYKKKSNTHALRQGKLTYSTCRDLFKQALQSVGVEASLFGLHSLRAGGATAAAAVGVPDRILKKHGRWSAESSKDGYVKESVENQLQLSLNIGI